MIDVEDHELALAMVTAFTLDDDTDSTGALSSMIVEFMGPELTDELTPKIASLAGELAGLASLLAHELAETTGRDAADVIAELGEVMREGRSACRCTDLDDADSHLRDHQPHCPMAEGAS